MCTKYHTKNCICVYLRARSYRSLGYRYALTCLYAFQHAKQTQIERRWHHRCFLENASLSSPALTLSCVCFLRLCKCANNTTHMRQPEQQHCQERVENTQRISLVSRNELSSCVRDIRLFHCRLDIIADVIAVVRIVVDNTALYGHRMTSTIFSSRTSISSFVPAPFSSTHIFVCFTVCVRSAAVFRICDVNRRAIVTRSFSLTSLRMHSNRPRTVWWQFNAGKFPSITIHLEHTYIYLFEACLSYLHFVVVRKFRELYFYHSDYVCVCVCAFSCSSSREWAFALSLSRADVVDSAVRTQSVRHIGIGRMRLVGIVKFGMYEHVCACEFMQVERWIIVGVRIESSGKNGEPNSKSGTCVIRKSQHWLNCLGHILIGMTNIVFMCDSRCWIGCLWFVIIVRIHSSRL